MQHTIAGILTLYVGASASAQFHIGDIWVGLDGNQLITGQVSPDQTVDTTARAFRATFGDSGFEGFTSNPGYDAAQVFNPAYRIGFNILSPLQVWNGNGFESTSGESLTLSFLTLSRTSDACMVPGFDLAVQANGGWHRHLSMFLNPPSGSPAAPGIYLIELELYYTAPGSIASDPYWIVFNYNDTTTHHEQAIAWVNDNLVAPTCAGDVDDSGGVDIDDLLAVIADWGDAACSPADVTDDGPVDINDLLAVIAQWGPCSS